MPNTVPPRVFVLLNLDVPTRQFILLVHALARGHFLVKPRSYKVTKSNDLLERFL